MSITYNANYYAPNNLIRLSGSFYDVNGHLADPNTVILWVSGPDGNIKQFNPVKDVVGVYHYDYTTATPGGKWYYRFQGLGAVIAQTPDILFNVVFPKF